MHGLNKDIIFPLQIFAFSGNVLYNFPEQGIVPVLYIIHAQDETDSLERRLSARPAYLARLQLLHDEGRLLTADSMPAVDNDDPEVAGFTGLTVIVESGLLGTIQAWTDADPYVATGVYEYVSMKPFKKVFRIEIQYLKVRSLQPCLCLALPCSRLVHLPP